MLLASYLCLISDPYNNRNIEQRAGGNSQNLALDSGEGGKLKGVVFVLRLEGC